MGEFFSNHDGGRAAETPSLVDGAGGAARAHVRHLLEPSREVVHEGRRYVVIPGPECASCRGTGHVRQHGAPRSERGPAMTAYCSHCGRDPLRWVSDRCLAQLVRSVLRHAPELR